MGLMQEPSYQRLYVGSLHFSLTEDDVRQIFEPFGPLDFVNLHKGKVDNKTSTMILSFLFFF